MIEIPCPHCGHQLRIHEKFAGQKGGCKYCQGTFIVPKVIAAPPRSVQAPASMAPASPAAAQAPGAEAVPELAGPTIPQGVPGPPAARVPGPGVLFWAVVFLFPPAGLIWALTLPKGHPHKYGAVLVPSLLVFTNVVLAGLSTAMVVTGMGMAAERDPIVYTSSSTGLYYEEGAPNLPQDARRARLSDAIQAGYHSAWAGTPPAATYGEREAPPPDGAPRAP